MSTKDLILSTAKDMISEVGFHKMTTASLARRADISEGTIYRHFESKEDILQHILDHFDEREAGRVRERVVVGDVGLGEHLAFEFFLRRAEQRDRDRRASHRSPVSGVCRGRHAGFARPAEVHDAAPHGVADVDGLGFHPGVEGAREVFGAGPGGTVWSYAAAFDNLGHRALSTG